MEIKHGTLIGYWLNGGSRREVKAWVFEGDANIYPVTFHGNGMSVRSRDFVLPSTHAFEAVDGYVAADATKFPASREGDVGGYYPPADFKVPTGYGEVTDDKGFKYIAPVNFIQEGKDTFELVGSTGVASTGTTGTTTRAAFLSNPLGWLKENPLLAFGIAALGYLLFLAPSGKKGKKKGLLSSIF